MPTEQNNWHVITGGPSTGKTTLLAELEKRGHKTVTEAARTVIDQALANGVSVQQLRADEKQFQKIVLEHKVQIEKMHSKDIITFFDRGMHDTLAYLQLKTLEIEASTLKALKQAHYKKVFLLDPLDAYIIDYARTETAAEAAQLNELLHTAFADYGMVPIRVPALPVSERADFVLQHVQ